MLLEKFDDDEINSNTKQMIDCLLCLQYCSKKYGIHIIQSYLKEIYDKLKSIILYGNDNTVTEVSLKLIQCIIKLICNQKTIQIGYYQNNNTNIEQKQTEFSISFPQFHYFKP